MLTPVDLETGTLMYPAVDGENIAYDIHPITHTSIIGFKVPQWEKIKEMAETLGYRVVMNDHPEYGQGHSIALGVGACQNNACILMVADMPYLKLDTLKKMASIQDGKHIVICEYNGILCNPMLLPECYYEKAKRLCNDKGAKQIIGNDMYLTVSLSEEEFMDIDEKTEAI